MFNKAYGYMLKHPVTRRGYWGQWYYRPRYEKVMSHLRKLGCKGAVIVLELGCERGIYAELLDRDNCTCYYVGCDIEREYLHAAYQGQRTDYLECDVRRLPFTERCADVVLCSEVLEHLSSPYQALASMSALAMKAILVTFPVEEPLSMFKDRHPEHVSRIRGRMLTDILVSNDLKVVANFQIFSSFVPCGLLEFLRIPRNRFTQTVISSIDKLLKRIVPSALVPHKTMLIEAIRSSRS